MNLQAQPKAQNKRKRCAFGDQEPASKEQPPPLKAPPQSLRAKEEQYEAHEGPAGVASTTQPVELPPTNNLALLNSVVYGPERTTAAMLSQQAQVSSVKWPNSVMAPGRGLERGGGGGAGGINDSGWQQQPGQPPPHSWNHLSLYSGPKGSPHPGVGVSPYYNHPEALKGSKPGVPQLDHYGNAVQPMVPQKVPLEVGRPQAPLNSFHAAKKPPNQTLPLQPFQLAFGHQMNRQVFRQGPQPPNASTPFPPQKQPQPQPQQQQPAGLPQMQLFESFYPMHQPPSQQPQDFGLAPGGPLGQTHLSHHSMAPYPFPHNPDLNPELRKALLQDSGPQPVLPQPQMAFPRRSRRLSKEGILPSNSLDGAGAQPGQEPTGNLFLHHWPLQQPPPPPGSLGQPHPEDLRFPLELRESQLLADGERLAPNGREREAPPMGNEEVMRAGALGDCGQMMRGGVIQSTRRRRRASQEANLLTLAQKAVELASLQDANGAEEKRKSVLASTAKCGVEFSEPALAAKRAREESGMVPLIIPVSVPVRTVGPPEVAQVGSVDEDGKGLEHYPTEHKPSVIVTRRRSTRVPGTDAPAQAEELTVKLEGETSLRKPKQRPRPEPLIIPTKAGTFIAPPVYSNITPYQSHLRSPVRLADHPSERSFELPPYTPPPILSPVREGSGLYFNAIISTSSIPAPPPITPKSAHRTLLRSNSSEVTPPVLSVMGEATPVSIEPRINVGTRFQAEIPTMRDRALAAADPHKADLVWQPWEHLESNWEKQRQVDDLLTAACSSIFPGAGTNQELALHYLHESRGDILETLNKLLLKKPVRPHNHPLATYHYTGSDQWKMAEKKLFNKGIAIYKKDFFLVQKLIQTKTVAQCVEFYYTYKKQVKIGRNGTLTFGDVDTSDEKSAQEEVEVDVKTSQKVPRVPPPRRESPSEERLEPKREVKEPRTEGKEEEVTETQEKGEQEEGRERSRRAAAVKATQTLQANEAANDVLILRSHEPNAPGPAGAQTSEKPREGPGKSRRALPFTEKKKKPEAFNKTQNQENTFPCKKCGRVFYKVKSRSAHMKSHAEQEKKAAALRLKEKEAAAAAANANAAHQQALREESGEGEKG